jgi:hypothetical protein
MTYSSFTAAVVLASAVLFSSVEAQAYCGVISESASGRTVERASFKAQRQVQKKINKLRREHGRKLVADEASVGCTGGGVAIDANGNQINGRPNCTVTRSFCVNP